MSELSWRRRLAFLLIQTLLFGGLVLLLAELGARYAFGFRPVTHDYFIFEYDPQRGWRQQANADEAFVKLGFQQPIKINSKGLREREIPYEKPPGLFRVLVIGDSNVASFEVASEESWLRVTEARLKERGVPVEFINGGHRGYGTDQSLLFLKEEGMKYEPDLVLYFWSQNDLDDNRTIHRPYRKYAKPYFALDDQGAPTLRGVPVPRFDLSEGVMIDDKGEIVRVTVPAFVRVTLWLRDKLIARSAAATGLAYAIANMPALTRTVVAHSTFADFQAMGEPALDRDSRLFRLTAALVREMQRAASEGGSRFQLIGMGGPWPAGLLEVTGMPDLGVHERFRQTIPSPKEVFTPFDPHWNALGHRIYGELLADALLQHGLVPSERPGRTDAPASR